MILLYIVYFYFSFFSGKIFQLSIIEETHLMKSQGSYKLNDVLSTGIVESCLPLSLQVI